MATYQGATINVGTISVGSSVSVNIHGVRFHIGVLRWSIPARYNGNQRSELN